VIVAIFGKDKDVTYKFFIPQLRLVFVRAKNNNVGNIDTKFMKGKNFHLKLWI
jgi:hypothetical protein